MRLITPPIFVPYEASLARGILQDRRDRFIASVKLDNDKLVDAHCINPGRMEAFVESGARVFLLPAANEARKLKWSWEAIERVNALADCNDNIMCGANTVRPNALIRAALESRLLAGLADWTTLKAEPKFEIAAEHSSDGEPHSDDGERGRC